MRTRNVGYMMKRKGLYIFSTGLILIFFFFAYDTLYASNNLRLIEQKSAVVKIVTYDDSGSEKGWATGYFINDKGHILTHASAIKDAYSAEVFSDFNYYGDIKVLKIDEDRDLALISVKPAEESYIVIDSEAIPEPGEKIFAIGYHFGAEKMITEGEIIFSESSETVPEVFSTSIPALPGVDYGPLLNSEGKIIGTALPPNRDDTRVYGTNITSIREFLLMSENVEKHLQPSRSRIGYKKYIKWFQINVIGRVISFLFLEGPGKVVNIFIAIIVIVFVIQWIIEKINFQKK